MAERAYWQGQLRLALVSIPVEIYTATRSGAAVSFRQIHEPSGKPIHYEKVVTGIGAVDPDEIQRGYEYEKGSYVLLDDEELAAVRLESRRTLELVQFVAFDEIDIFYFEKPYYVVPADALAEEAFVVLREAMRQSKTIGIGQLAMRGREHIVALRPCGRGLVMETLRYAEEVRRAQSYFRDIPDAKPDADLLDLAKSLIANKKKPFDPDRFHDHYAEAVRELVERKLKAKGRKVVADEEAPTTTGATVIDLMAALKKSLDRAPDDKPAHRKRS